MRCCNPGDHINLFSPAMLYNPGGKLWLTDDSSFSQLNLDDYLERVYDLEGYLRLVRIQAAMFMAGSDSPAGWLEEPALGNPYTGSPMNWETRDRELSFECMGLGNYCAISL